MTGKKKKWIMIGAIILIVVVALGIKVHKQGSLVVPRNVSFSKTAKGKRIWLDVYGEKGDDPVDKVVYQNNGKATTYRIFNRKFTIAQAEKMSDSQLLSYAKSQDKRLYESYPKALRNDWKEHASTNMNVNMPSVLPGETRDAVNYQYSYVERHGKIDKLYLPKAKYVGTKGYVVLDSQGKVLKNSSELPYSDDGKHVPKGASLNLYRGEMQDNEPDKQYLAPIYKQAAQKIERTKYQKPKAYPIKTTVSTQDGTVVGETATISYIDPYKFDDLNKVITDMAKNNPKLVQSLIQNTNFNDQLMKKVHSDNPNTDLLASDPDKDAQNLKRYQRGVDAHKDDFVKEYAPDFLKEIVGHFKHNYEMDLDTPTEFTINDQRYIGFHIDRDEYFVTKAQNDKQNVVPDR